jgi:DNA polymerase (family 10)
MITNKQFAKHLSDIAFFYNQENQTFKANAYIKAAHIVEQELIPLVFENNKLKTKLPNVGKSAQQVIEQYNANGTSDKYEYYLSHGFAPPSVQQLMRIPQIGIKTAKKLYDKYKIGSLQQFELNIDKLIGTEFEKYIEPYFQIKNQSDRLPRFIVKPIIDSMINPLIEMGFDIAYAGSIRRGKDLIKDVDVIVSLKPTDDKNQIKTFLQQTFGLTPDIRDGNDKWGFSVPINDQFITLDLNFCTPETKIPYLMYFTGSKQFNIDCRGHFKQRGLLLNQNGLFNQQNQPIAIFETEQQLFEAIGIKYIPPQCREDDCFGKDFSNIITEQDIIIELHTHTTDSDGSATIEQLVSAAAKENYRVIGISDHSSASGFGLAEQQKLHAIENFNAIRHTLPIETIYGAEIDVLTSGQFDYTSEVIDKLDYFIIAAHHNHNKNVTERFCNILKQYKTKPKIIAHPTGRKVGTRDPAEIDWALLIETAKQNNCVVEINCWEDRADLPSEIIKKIKDTGIYFTISTDTHSDQLRSLHKVGIVNAQRGWLTKDRVINCNYDLYTKWMKGTLYE